MSRIVKTIVSISALMMINGGPVLADHWKAGVNYNVHLCFQETEKVANGADPETLSTLYCTRALRAERLSREDRSATHHNRGIIQKAQGHLVAAKESLEKAVHLSKTVDQRNLALAEVARELGDFGVALEQYDLLANSAFVADSQDLRAAVSTRRQEADTAYLASVQNGRTCTGCHGADGISVKPGVPTLAGRSDDYLEHALYEYKSGERENAVMAFQATLIADADVSALARYYGSLDPREQSR